MKIRLTPDVALMLETASVQSRGMEFSGFGFVNVDKEKQEFVVYKAFILHVGSVGYTQIDPKKILPVLSEPDSQNLKCWFHKHPMGSHVPSPFNWSGTDNATIKNEPLGGNPKLVQWSISIVRTPDGWVGRVDNHIAGTTEHLKVLGQAPRSVFDTMQKLGGTYTNWNQEDIEDRPKAKFEAKEYVQGAFSDLDSYVDDYLYKLEAMRDELLDTDPTDDEAVSEVSNLYIQIMEDISDEFGCIPHGLDEVLDDIDEALTAFAVT